ncbi:MAG: hypothetical protein LBN39_05525 [Planctomycetaceae bacterium]|jgi:tetratricopeptide (TPR) repeat protein|nr:hypothetical protein [Planctomycetaceae bacterium]
MRAITVLLALLVFTAGLTAAVSAQVQTGGYPVRSGEIPVPLPKSAENTAAAAVPEKTTADNFVSETKPSFWDSALGKTKTYFSNILPKKETKDGGRQPKKPSADDAAADNGLKEIADWVNEQRYSEPEYIESATRSKNTTAKDMYRQGLQAENAGNIGAAIRCYSAFITANSKQIFDGTLAAPYHRLALIAWKRQDALKNAGIYFRYAMRYAKGGNVPIIAGDYALFLTEQDDWEGAEVVLRNALVYYAEDKRLLYYLAKVSAGQERPIQALRYFTAAVGKEQAYQEMAAFYRQHNEFVLAQHFDEKRYELLAKNGKVPQGAVPLVTPADNFNPIVFKQDNSQLSFTNQLSGGWQPAPVPPPMPFVPIDISAKIPDTQTIIPVSQVIHYPGGSDTPVYYEYQGNNYPKE